MLQDMDSLHVLVLLSRFIWLLFILSILLGTDLPYVSNAYIRQLGHYGKLAGHEQHGSPASSSNGWIPALIRELDRLSLPARLVWASFYAIASAVNLAALLMLLPSPPLVLALLQAHLVRRLLETLAITRFSPNRREHPLGQLVGVTFYLLLSPSVALEWTVLSPKPSLPSVVAGTVMFLVGNLAQHVAHRELASLRTGKGELGEYKVPVGWLFQNVSVCPHYTCELTIYLGLAVIGGLLPCQLLALIFSAGNLSLTAVRTKRLYASRGGHGASKLSRFAIIPYVL
jgi:hypothetical protein